LACKNEKAAALIRQRYQLDGILEAKKLKVLSVRAPGSAYLCGLREWFHWLEMEFERRGRRVSIEFNNFN
jgi:hypothetical protein